LKKAASESKGKLSSSRLAQERTKARVPASELSTARQKEPGREAARNDKVNYSSAPAEGSLLWSGDVKQRPMILVIDRAITNVGTVEGTLPGIPCQIQIDDPDVTISEFPSPSNGYKRIMLRLNKKGRTSITIRWKAVR
jgi:hypothetical protein